MKQDSPPSSGTLALRELVDLDDLTTLCVRAAEVYGVGVVLVDAAWTPLALGGAAGSLTELAEVLAHRPQPGRAASAALSNGRRYALRVVDHEGSHAGAVVVGPFQAPDASHAPPGEVRLSDPAAAG